MVIMASANKLSSNDKYSDLEEVPLAGYTNRLSARPGDTVKFYLSSALARVTNDKKPLKETRVRARLTSSICADPNPKGSGIVEEDASLYFEQRSIGIQHQPIPRGSYAQTRSNLCISSSFFKKLQKIRVELWFYPTSVAAKSKFGPKNSSVQNVWSWGDGFRLDLLPTGNLSFAYLSKEDPKQQQLQVICTAAKPLKQHRWYHISSTLELQVDRKSVSCNLCLQEKDDQSEESLHNLQNFSNLVAINSDIFLECIDAPFILASGSLNGRLEDPEIKIQKETEKEFLLAAWDTSTFNFPEDEMLQKCTDPWTIPCNRGLNEAVSNTHVDNDMTLGNHALILHNHPTRGVKGRRWNGTEFCWTKYPKHYGAIHFHDDDIYDFKWKVDMEWKVPPNTPSGIYIMRFTDEKDNEEALPIFICASKIPVSKSFSERQKLKRNKLVLLIPTFTYIVYGNHARPDFEKDLWLARTKKSSPGSYPYNPVLFPAYGHSCYDFHSDQTGIHFASHLRPLFNLRPGYITFSRVGGYNDKDQETQKNSDAAFCSGLRHFPADSHIVSWLHHFGFDFDVITDHELHREGSAALAQYSTLLTCTHPEYHTPQSLDALQKYRDIQGGNLIYLGGNGFYWKIGASRTPSPKVKDGIDGANDDALYSCQLLEIRRCEGGVRTWAAEAGEYYNLLDGMYGGLWRNSGRPPSKLAGIGFAAQGSFIGKPYHRTCWDRPDITDWVFRGISDEDAAVLGDFGYSGDGAAGYELDRIDPNDELYRDGDIVILAQADTKADSRYALVPEEVLTPWTNLAGTSNEEAKRADMIYFRVPQSGSKVFSVGSITFCGCLPFNNFENAVSRLIKNVVDHFLEEDE